MTIRLEVGGASFAIDAARAIDLSIPVRFGDRQVRAFGLPQARAEVARSGSFVGSVAEGGSCNCRTVTFNPHGSGTHTEGLGHLVAGAPAPYRLVAEALLAATLVTVEPEGGVVTARALRQALAAADPHWLEAVVLRTQLADRELTDRDWSSLEPSHVSFEAAALLARQTSHLIVDLPSLDPMWDGGRLLAHRAFLGEAGDRRTVTELAAVPPEVPDGRYALSLQIAPLELDAAPSRPLLYPL